MQEFWIYLYLNDQYEKCAKLIVTEEKFTLQYTPSYLNLPGRIDIDPLNLVAYPKKYEAEELFASISDCAPDYWGQQLLNRKFQVSELNDMEYVLANNLEHVGALAFSPIGTDHPMQLTPNGWRPHKEHHVILEQIIKQTELMIKDADGNKLKELFEFGPTLGGGRPKVSLILNAQFYLAKYSTSLDSLPEPQIEYATMSMAKDLGLNVPHIELSEHQGRKVYLMKRFDRSLSGKKIVRNHFVSALSLCNWHVFGMKDWNYPAWCQHIRKAGHSENEIRQDLCELFKRVAFNIAVNNDDDHPRNHGLLCVDGSWHLAPLYDVVPKAMTSNRFTSAMSIGIYDREASARNLLSACKYFELEKTEAQNIINSISSFVQDNWRQYFRNAGIKKNIIAMFENAFSSK